MYFRDFLAVLRRRWRTVLVGALITILAGVGAIFFVPTNRQATGQMILLLPPKATGVAPINPYLNLDPGLTVVASLIAATVSSDDTKKQLEQQGLSAEYSIALVPGTGPVLDLSVDDVNAARAVLTRDVLMRRLEAELRRIQVEENVPTRQYIHARANNVSASAEAVPGNKIRALGVIGALGVVITFVIAFVRDRRRSESRESKQTAVPAWESADIDPATKPNHEEGQPGDAPRHDAQPVPSAEERADARTSNEQSTASVK